ncbi:MAG: antibiotic biosynthesis monooxygenase [Candidatus Thiodiazotropha sp.]
MFIVANRVPVAESYRDAFEARFRDRAGKIEQQPGFVRMQVLKPAQPGLTYVVLTTWEDKDSFESWVGSEDFRRAHANPMPAEAFDGEGGLEMHEVIISAGV